MKEGAAPVGGSSSTGADGELAARALGVTGAAAGASEATERPLSVGCTGVRRLDAIGVVDTEFGTHLVVLEKQYLGVAEGRSQKIRTRRMLDTPDERTGLRS